MILRASLIAAFVLLVPAAAAQSDEAMPDANTICGHNATICVSETYQSAVATGFGMAVATYAKADPDAVKSLGVKIAFYGTDVVPPPVYPAGMKGTCVGGDCIYYKRNCGPERCIYTIGKLLPPDGDRIRPSNFAIDFTSAVSLAGAEKNIFFYLGPDGHKMLVRLSKLFPPSP